MQALIEIRETIETYLGTKVANSPCLFATALTASRAKIKRSAAYVQAVCPRAISN